jgi:ribosomal protein L23
MSTIIKKPIITEKATLDSEMNNRFTFVVDRKANKIEIKNAIEKMYGVTVKSVRTLIRVSLSNVMEFGKKPLLLLPKEKRLICIVTFKKN